MDKENENVEELITEEEIEEEDEDYVKMDYSIESPEARKQKVEEIIAKTPPEKLTSRYLEKLADYIVFALDKQERKEKKILTENRLVTVNKRETSYEGLVGRMENGEDGIYGMIANDKNIIFAPKVTITDADVAEVPGLASLRDAIQQVEAEAKTATGKRAFALKKQLIEMRQDQYILKNSFKRPIHCINLIKSFPKVDLTEEIGIDEKGDVYSTGIVNFYNEAHINALLNNYSKIKEDSWSNFVGDSKWMIMDFENLVDLALKDEHPMLYDMVKYKIDGLQNSQIQEKFYEDYGVKHSTEYLSSLWCKKIPKIIVETAKKEWLIWHFTVEEKGKWKRCSRCGQIKLAHNFFFSKNNTSKDGFYSICKICRNTKKKK